MSKSSVIALFMLMLNACLSQEPPEKQQNNQIRSVRRQAAVHTATEQSRSFPGVVHASIESKLSFKVAGTLEVLMVKVGDKVDAGQEIARLDPTDYQLKMQEAEAALMQAKAKLRNAEADYHRTRQLYEHQNAARNDLDAARAAAESAQAAVQSAQKQLELTQLQLSYTRLHSSQACAVAALPVEKNENIKAGQPIVVVNCGQRLEVEVAVPESLIIAIQTGQPTTVTFDALPKQSFAATITEVGVASSQATTTFPVIVRLQDSTPEIRPGMTAEVSFQFATQDSTLVVPSAAVHEDRQGRFVFVVEPLENKELAIVHRRAVEVGALTENGLEILSGLQVGEQVVTAGISQLQEGLKVRLLPEKPYNS